MHPCRDLLVGMLLCVLHSGSLLNTAEPLIIAAASDLGPAMDELKWLHPQPITVVLGSTGLLARQIAQVAPFDLFFAANRSFADDLVRNGHGVADSAVLYGRGRIVVWTRAAAPAPAPVTLTDLLADRFVHIAIANPEHAPYGQAAKEALQNGGWWDRLEPRMVYGENVSQTLQLAQSGNADVAIVALSLAVAAPGGRWMLIDDALHAPIDQVAVMTTQARDPIASRAFLAAVASPAGRTIMRRYGFVLPGEALDSTLLRTPDAP